jgi:hypothetical protein
MKAYVTQYRSKRHDDQNEHHFGPTGNVDVIFHRHPEWEIVSEEEAKTECRLLQNMRVHVGEHYCELSVEELPKGTFAIVCLSHPDWTQEQIEQRIKRAPHMKAVPCPNNCGEMIPQGKLKSTERSIPIKDGKPVESETSYAQRWFESECPKCGPVLHNQEAVDTESRPI